MKQPGKVYLIDTNTVLRYLLDDHEKYSPRAKAFIMDIAEGTKKLRSWMTVGSRRFFAGHIPSGLPETMLWRLLRVGSCGCTIGAQWI